MKTLQLHVGRKRSLVLANLPSRYTHFCRNKHPSLFYPFRRIARA